MAAIIPFLPAIAGAAASGLSGFMGARQPRETEIQKRQRGLIDQILASVEGQGPFSDLFNMDNEAFQKSFVDPAKQMFQSQIAPQIQQSYIASGQQRGTGLEDALTRAGVDLDQNLNQQFAQFQQGALDRKSGALSSILGMSPGALPQQSGLSGIGQGIGGFASSEAFPEILRQFSNFGSSSNIDQNPLRRGFSQ